MKRQSLRAAPYAVRQLDPADRGRLVDHFVALDASDRGLRFGTAADEAAIVRYVQAIDFGRDTVLGVEGHDGALVGVAHVANHDGVAELGLSVVGHRRRRGLASALASDALRTARQAAAREFRLHCAAANEGMRRIARGLGMTITTDGGELVARRVLVRKAPPPLAAVAPEAGSGVEDRARAAGGAVPADA